MSTIPFPTIDEIQEDIIAEFQSLGGDRSSILTYITELGEKMPPLDASYKTNHNLISGCKSKVWLIYKKQGDRLFFEADSNTAITKGLVSLLVRVLSGQRLEDIIRTHLHFVARIGMLQHIGSQRAGGFGSMLKEMKLIAITEGERDKQEASAAQ
ncbi:MAG: SufE family protein [Roseivirga sp.]